MKAYSLVHLSDQTLLRDLVALVAQDRSTTAAMLAHLAEVDARKLYLPAAYPSMYAWCVGELKLSEEAAYKRIHAARVARRFPAIFPMLADGRLHLSAVILLAAHLTPDNADDLLAAAGGKTKAEVEQLLAERFPRPDLPMLVQALAPASAGDGHVPARDGALAPVSEDALHLAARPVCETGEQHAPGRVVAQSHNLGPQPAEAPRAKPAPLSPGRFALQLTIAQETHDKLRYAQALLGHSVPSGDLAQVLDRALDALIQKLEQRRFAAVTRSRKGRVRRGRADGRYVPASVRRLVWQRDHGQCTFVSDSGRRCPARTRLEFDHIEPFARGGQATPSGLRLRCRAHNQHDAERVYGPEFMRHKREQARDRARERAHAKARERATAEAREREVQARVQEVVPWLRSLGFSLAEAQRGAARCADMPDASLEQCVRAALASLAPSRARRAVPVASPTA